MKPQLEVMKEKPTQEVRHRAMSPITAPASSFPGALPRDVIRGLKNIDPALELQWSPRFECWEVWHKVPFKQPYVFFRHMLSSRGGFLPADRRIISQVLSRVSGGWYCESRLHEIADTVRHTEIPLRRDPDYVRWRNMRKLET